jgi:bifunctional DNase/RNase
VATSKKIKLEILGLSSSQSQNSSFALVLGEEGGTRRLPIIIGMFEAQAIAIEIEKIVPNRPMTHDLFKSFSESFDFMVEEVVIYGLKEGVFFAHIICSNDVRSYEIDARPSDAIAIGLRFGASIYTFENIMSEAGIIVSNDDDDLDSPPSIPQPKKSWVEQLKDTPTDKLQTMLDETLGQEDYEKAAKIRDELNRRN